MKIKIKSLLIVVPSRSCYTVPVSSTGSLWTGYGGWRYSACSFSLVKLNTHLKARINHSACRFIHPGVDYFTNPYPSAPLSSHSPLRRWAKIDMQVSVPMFQNTPQKWAA
ncbi:hypothetical protein GO755_38425 [Spirosoma sp. HMF4905]|uniref:Uncharacterized protein n=1 Tax=Spirosoma arboris TaxID=2682092 RepID=A0A7K1SQI2_9BACT|nr:hypothetical protein [Spirosoma arboris]MVM35953.1 hypothetical protein [Spirosoma arboris]